MLLTIKFSTFYDNNKFNLILKAAIKYIDKGDKFSKHDFDIITRKIKNIYLNLSKKIKFKFDKKEYLSFLIFVNNFRENNTKKEYILCQKGNISIRLSIDNICFIINDNFISQTFLSYSESAGYRNIYCYRGIISFDSLAMKHKNILFNLANENKYNRIEESLIKCNKYKNYCYNRICTDRCVKNHILQKYKKCEYTLYRITNNTNENLVYDTSKSQNNSKIDKVKYDTEIEKHLIKFYVMFNYLFDKYEYMCIDRTRKINLKNVIANKFVFSSRILKMMHNKDNYLVNLNLPLSLNLYECLEKNILYANKYSRLKIIKIIYALSSLNNFTRKVLYHKLIGKIIIN